MMRKFIIIGWFLLFLMLLSTCVYAAEPQITIEGENKASPGATKIVTLKVSSDEIEAGVVSGKIEKSINVDSIEVTGKNDWNLTYNEGTGVFNVYKAEGAKTEEILNIQYTLKNEEGTAKITVSDIEITTIDYETTNIEESIVKEIKIIEENEPEGNEPEGNEPDGNEPDGNEPDGNKPEGDEPDGDKPEGNKPDGNKPDKDDTTSHKEHVYAGVEDYAIAIIAIIIIIAFVSYKKYQQYKNI